MLLNTKTVAFLFVGLSIFSACSTEQNENKKITTINDSMPPTPSYPLTPAQTEEIQTYYPGGRPKVKGVLINGKREGIWISWYENGKEWSECTYKNGVKNGPIISWHENGRKRYEGFYENDMKTGKWSYWNAEGQLSKETDHGKHKK